MKRLFSSGTTSDDSIFNTVHHKRANAKDGILAESLNQHFAAISKQILEIFLHCCILGHGCTSMQAQSINISGINFAWCRNYLVTV